MKRRNIILAAVTLVAAAAVVLLGTNDKSDDADAIFFGRNLRVSSLIDPKTVEPKAPPYLATDATESAAEKVVAAYAAVASTTAIGTFFIDPAKYTEGFSGWKVVLSQVLGMVEIIPGASLVEPCMMNGRLVSCATPYPLGGGGSPVPVSEILDMSRELQHGPNGEPPTMALYGDYVRRTQELGDGEVTRNFHVCLKASQPSCPEPYTTRITSDMTASSKKESEITTYTIYTCWWGRCALELNKLFLRTMSRDSSLPRVQITIHPRIYDTVKSVLAGVNIEPDHYSLVHWRGESKRMDYIKCAETVVDIKNNIANNMVRKQDHPVLVMTSLNEDVSKQWNGEKIKGIGSNGTPKEALDILNQAGLIRFDKLLQNANIDIPDPGMLVIYDLILAKMSRIFTTCSHGPGGEPGGKGSGLAPGCSEEQNKICHDCNYFGKFARLALDMRLETPGLEERTMGCWPV